MRYSNFHTHSTFCDGLADAEEFILKAIENNMEALGFSGHAPFLYDTFWSTPKDKFDDYLKEIARLKVKYQDKIKIYQGLEIDFIKDKMGVSTFKDYNLDYTISSIHFIDQFENGKYWGIDNTIEDFANGLEVLYNNDIEKVVNRYYYLIQELVKNEKPDVLGHWDIIKKNNKGDKFFSESEKWYKKAVLETIKVIAESGVIVEINTRGVTTQRTNTLYPSDWITEEMFKHDIPVTISADAHKPEEVCAYFDETVSILKDIGYKQIRNFNGKDWVPVNI